MTGFHDQLHPPANFLLGLQHFDILDGHREQFRAAVTAHPAIRLIGVQEMPGLVHQVIPIHCRAQNTGNLLLPLLARGDVHQRGAASFAVRGKYCLQVDVPRWPALGRQPHLAHLIGSGRKYPRQELAQGVPVGFRHEHAEPPAHQPGALQAQKTGAGQVDQADGAVGGEGEIAHGREVEKVGVAIQSVLNGRLGRAKLLILQLQFNLMNFQLVLEPAQIGLGLRRRAGRVRLELSLGALSQGGGLLVRFRFHNGISGWKGGW
jgi:hypothetical protein